MGDDIIKKEDFENAVKKATDEKIKEEKLNERLEAIAKASTIYPDVLQHLGELRTSIEKLNDTISLVQSNQKNAMSKYADLAVDLSGVFDKVRSATEAIDELEDRLVDRNNSNSLIEVITNLIENQNKEMTDQNNNKSIISILKKSINIQSTVTWIMLSALTIFTIIGRIFGN